MRDWERQGEKEEKKRKVGRDLLIRKIENERGYIGTCKWKGYPMLVKSILNTLHSNAIIMLNVTTEIVFVTFTWNLIIISIISYLHKRCFAPCDIKLLKKSKIE